MIMEKGILETKKSRMSGSRDQMERWTKNQIVFCERSQGSRVRDWHTAKHIVGGSRGFYRNVDKSHKYLHRQWLRQVTRAKKKNHAWWEAKVMICVGVRVRVFARLRLVEKERRREKLYTDFQSVNFVWVSWSWEQNAPHLFAPVCVYIFSYIRIFVYSVSLVV